MNVCKLFCSNKTSSKLNKPQKKSFIVHTIVSTKKQKDQEQYFAFHFVHLKCIFSLNV